MALARQHLVFLCIPLFWTQAACGDIARDPINCNIKLTLSGGLNGTYNYGDNWRMSKGCSGTGEGERFDIGITQDDMPSVHIVVCGLGPGEIGEARASLFISDGTNSWSSGENNWFDCSQGACPVTITINDLERMEDEPFTGGEYWIKGTGHCDEALLSESGTAEPVQVEGEFSFGGMPGLWE